MKVYSPSATTNFMASPASHYLRYEQGWEPYRVDKGDLAAILGTAFTKAVAEFWRLGGHSFDVGRTSVLESLSEKYAVSRLKELADAGAQIDTKVIDLYEVLPMRAASIIRNYIPLNPIPTAWEVKAVEPPLPDHGNARPDLIVSPMDGVIAPLDYKCKLMLTKSKYYDPHQRNCEEINHAWQMMHYAWACGDIFGTRPDVFYVVFLYLEPSFEVVLEDFYIDQEILALWYQSAETVWALMEHMETGSIEPLQRVITEKGRLYPWHNFQWFDRWGKSDYTEAFLECKLHKNLLEKKYINRRKK